MRRADWLLLVWVAALAAVFLRAGWHHGAGLPLDDPYIYFDYARSAAAGHWLQYNPGDPPTSGATSLLWLALLTVGRWCGIHGAGMLWWDFGLSLLCTAGGALLCRRAASRLGAAGWQAAALAGAACATGALAFALADGLEVPLACLALCAVAEALAAGSGRRVLLLGVLMPLVRPDLALVLAVVLAVRRPPWGLLPAAALAAYAGLMRAWTGTAVMAGGSAKLLALAPGAGILHAAPVALAGAAAALADPWGWVLPLPHLTPLWLATAILLWVLVAFCRAPRSLAVLGLLGVALEGAAFGPGVPGYQFGRYLAPYAPLLLLAAFAGARRLGRERYIPVAALGLAVAGLPAWVGLYGVACGEIAAEQVAIGQWVDRTLPRQAVLVVNDAGAMAYYGHRYTIDAIGITTRGFAAAAREPGQPGEIAALQLDLAARGLQGRPVYAAIYPDWLPTLADAGAPVAQFRLPGRPVVDEAVVEVGRLG